MEVNRASRDVAPLLFSFFEGKLMDGKKLNNCYIAAAINIGDDYETLIDFTDKALRRRVTFLGMNPDIKDFHDFIAANNYHDTLQQICQFLTLDSVLHYDAKLEYEQTTNFGSFNKINNRWYMLEKINKKPLTLEEIRMDILKYGEMFTSRNTKETMLTVISNLIESATINIHKELIKKDWIFGGERIYDRNGAEIENVREKTHYFLFSIINFLNAKLAEDPKEGAKYLVDNINDIFRCFSANKTLLMSLMHKQVSPELKTIVARSFNDGVKILQKNPNDDIAKSALEFFEELKKFQIMMNAIS